jgi:hypothetical protein
MKTKGKKIIIAITSVLIISASKFIMSSATTATTMFISIIDAKKYENSIRETAGSEKEAVLSHE